MFLFNKAISKYALQVLNRKIKICIDFYAVACRSLVMPRVTAWLNASLPNYSIVQGHLVVIATGHMLFVMSQYDVIFTFANQHFGRVFLHNMHTIKHALSLLVVHCVTDSALQFRRPGQSIALHAKTEQFVYAKLSSHALKQVEHTQCYVSAVHNYKITVH